MDKLKSGFSLQNVSELERVKGTDEKAIEYAEKGARELFEKALKEK